MIVAIIPARGGSKRIPGKNIKPFRGQPVIAYSIEAARKAGVFDRIIVSTDSTEIAEIAREYGAEIPFLRPGELADDFAPTGPVLLHALDWLTRHVGRVRSFCCIYPVAPFIDPQDLREGYNRIMRDGAPAVIPVTTFSFPIFRAFTINQAGELAMLWPEHELTRSNDLAPAFHDVGQFYWCDAEAFSREQKLYLKGAVPLVLPRYRVQDIDTPEDWLTAEILYDVLMTRRSKE